MFRKQDVQCTVINNRNTVYTYLYLLYLLTHFEHEQQEIYIHVPKLAQPLWCLLLCEAYISRNLNPLAEEQSSEHFVLKKLNMNDLTDERKQVKKRT